MSKVKRQHDWERGFGNLRAILGIVVIGVVIFLSVKLIPPYVSNYQFQQQIDSVARYAAYAQGRTAEDIKQEVLAKARECDVLLTPEAVEVEKTGTTVNIDVKYVVQVELPGKTVEMRFNPVAGNKMITAR
jgi:hypothetical protein